MYMYIYIYIYIYRDRSIVVTVKLVPMAKLYGRHMTVCAKPVSKLSKLNHAAFQQSYLKTELFQLRLFNGLSIQDGTAQPRVRPIGTEAAEAAANSKA